MKANYARNTLNIITFVLAFLKSILIVYTLSVNDKNNMSQSSILWRMKNSDLVGQTRELVVHTSFFRAIKPKVVSHWSNQHA